MTTSSIAGRDEAIRVLKAQAEIALLWRREEDLRAAREAAALDALDRSCHCCGKPSAMDACSSCMRAVLVELDLIREASAPNLDYVPTEPGWACANCGAQAVCLPRVGAVYVCPGCGVRQYPIREVAA